MSFVFRWFGVCLIVACSAPEDRNPAERCVEGKCEPPLMCYRGFCLASESAPAVSDRPIPADLGAAVGSEGGTLAQSPPGGDAATAGELQRDAGGSNQTPAAARDGSAPSVSELTPDSGPTGSPSPAGGDSGVTAPSMPTAPTVPPVTPTVPPTMMPPGSETPPQMDAGARDPAASAPLCRNQPSCDVSCASAPPGSCEALCEGAKSCDISCAPALSCGLTCRDVDDCRPLCTSNASCQIRCQTAKKCRPVCAAASSCSVECEGGDCKVDCAPGAVCVVRCINNANCSFSSCSGMERGCSNNVRVCGTTCPDD